MIFYWSLSGLNCQGSGQKAGSWWRLHTADSTAVPCGTFIPQISTSRLARRPMWSGIGGYSRIDSDNTWAIIREYSAPISMMDKGKLFNFLYLVKIRKAGHQVVLSRSAVRKCRLDLCPKLILHFRVAGQQVGGEIQRCRRRLVPAMRKKMNSNKYNYFRQTPLV